VDNGVQFNEDQFASRRVTEAQRKRSLTEWMVAKGVADSEGGANAILLVCAIALFAIAGGTLVFSGVFSTRSGPQTLTPEMQAELHAMHAVGY
jgi:hypothetical protein